MSDVIHSQGPDNEIDEGLIVPGLSGCHDLREDFISRMREFASAHTAHDIALCELNRHMSSEISSRHAEKDVEDAVRSWVAGVCELVNREASNSGHLDISPSRLPSECSGIDLRGLHNDNKSEIAPLLGEHRIWEAKSGPLVEIAILFFPVAELYQALYEEVCGIEKAACVAAADKLGGELGLVSHRSSVHTCHVKETCGRVVLNMSNYGYSSSGRAGNFAQLAQIASTFETHADVRGLVNCLNWLRDAEWRLDYDKRIPSRTKICEGRPVEAVCFKEKVEFRFERPVFEALVSFVREHSTVCMLELAS